MYLYIIDQYRMEKKACWRKICCNPRASFENDTIEPIIPLSPCNDCFLDFQCHVCALTVWEKKLQMLCYHKVKAARKNAFIKCSRTCACTHSMCRWNPGGSFKTMPCDWDPPPLPNWSHTADCHIQTPYAVCLQPAGLIAVFSPLVTLWIHTSKDAKRQSR